MLRRRGIGDPAVLEAVRRTDRRLFVPAAERSGAFLDRPIPLPHRQVTTQPSRVARMLEALALNGGERVLEVGAGYGYASALLARLAGEVVAIERIPEIWAVARRNLEGFSNVRVLQGDGTLGEPDGGPFDAILCSAAGAAPSPRLVEQLREGGRLVQPLAVKRGGEVVLFEKSGKRLHRVRRVMNGKFVPLVGEFGAVGEEEYRARGGRRYGRPPAGGRREE